MFTRSRQSQNFNAGTPQRNQGGGSSQQQHYQQQQGGQGYNQQGNYQSGNQNQQTPYKQGNNTPLKLQQQQQQQTPQPQRNMQQVKQQSQTPQQPQVKQQPQTPQATPQPQRLKPILKSSAVNNQANQGQAQSQNQVFNQNSQNQQSQQSQLNQQNQQHQQNLGQMQQSNNGMDSSDATETIDSEVPEVPKWRRKTPGLKVNRKLKRLRMNQRLRKTLQPKNAIMVLNEMKTGVQFTFPETQSAMPNSLFLVHAEIEGKTYVGQGVSKPLARQNAAENALKSLLLEKMTAAAMKARMDAENEGASNSVVDTSENKEGDGTVMETTSEETDEIPWSSLASFALYKLFLEWQNQGTVVPVPRPGVSPGKVKKDSNKIVIQKELPPNATTIHPVMLLNQMRPGLTYTEVSRVGNPPNTMFTLAVDVDGQQYTGTAKNKKDAKKVAAKAALHALFNLVYPEEKEGEDLNMG
ncbi:transcription factor SPT20 homolog isoform X2 [Nasonia vitripennis]|uniref:DRBM domain-containing protein n=1 Tax=Nasonia vitripennis TaxID=7425 RepID=A0A7M7R2M7_NASVI|nr:transcription factor SPT20 homolog isoform X2 [Nasonia vitripennis]XP_032457522.1 transcription factor SPT20 homolog isoform X2 [Nasonia vitripennis]XP_032457523.1 transcription factor SPT20 homolog isoform X2 [Nasonia vitripennis]XP_032457524.1 transcription factor SPT20 homolog isoform X2 [Nasonia vitripennis]XP_032457525.1 transcription factor SPT20 homolog isoform X2 [Nasonia vitripennis]XP_032457526.1 transcription factor SPT20 homolog isoform X2 [Nasonia vitripennis]XP_032457527.1 tr